MRPLLALLLALSLLLPRAALAKGWPDVAYTTVRAYLYNTDGKLLGNHAPVKAGALDPSVVQPGVTLDAAKTAALLDVLGGDTRLLQAGLSGCYVPRHALVFYDAADKPVAWASVCFECERLVLYEPTVKARWPAREANAKEIAAAEAQLAAIREVVTGAGLPLK